MPSPDLKLITDRAPESAPIAEFADAMSALASGVVLVTCRVGERPWGMTVTAFASVSADPPTVLVSLDSEAAATRAITDVRRFGVSILAAGQIAVARYGSAPGATKFLEPYTEPDDAGSATPVVAGALAHLDCELVEAAQVADHTVLVGRVRAVQASRSGPPLLYHRRAYSTIAGSARPHPFTERMLGCLSS
jgi:3-hydroxy-9,10-secoandrosta-1,3,5(10)-triene-9,17-dione monooxygenase reductase component